MNKGAKNAKIIEVLDRWKEMAAGGEINSIALVATLRQDQYATQYIGAKGVENHLLRGLKAMNGELEAVLHKRRLGPRNFKLDNNLFEFPLSFGAPICFDFLVWLVDAEMTRVRLGAPAPLRLAFTGLDELDPVGRDFFECVMRPMLPLIGAVEDVGAKGGRHKPYYVPSDIVLNARAGEPVPMLQASDDARHWVDLLLHETQPIVITLREAYHYPQRNSNNEAWFRFAADLRAAGEEVIILRDTARAWEPVPVPGVASYPFASYNLDHRMALYERAKINFCISNGPGGLLIWSKVPYIYFNRTVEFDEAYMANNKRSWLRMNGLHFGEQWPWAEPNQRMIWGTDSYENISQAWEEFQPLLAPAKAA